MLNVVKFRTNDPTRGSARIEAVVKCVSGGISSRPESVVFGTVLIGEKIRRFVLIRDDALKPRVIETVTSTQPERVAVTLIPFQEKSEPPDPTAIGTLIGKLEVIVDSSVPGNVDAAVQVRLSGVSRDPDPIRVIGRISAPVEICPSVISLPRTSSAGPVYEATCIIRSVTGGPVELSIDPTPAGLTVTVLKPENARSQKVQVSWDPKVANESGSPQRQVIRIKAKTGEKEVVLELPVVLQS
jgi:hypothetical protein